MKIVVTGGSGFIGTHFVRTYVEAGHEVVVLDLHPPEASLAERVSFIRCDVRDGEGLKHAFEGADRVLHLAAAHHDFGITRQTFFEVNEAGAGAICAALDHHGIRDLCFYSSVAVYGEIGAEPDEASTPEPISDYGESKLAGEAVFKAWTEKGEGRTCLVIRPTVTFGEGHFANMYTLVRQIRSGKFVRVTHATNRKSLAYVENIVAATEFLWDRMAAAEQPAFDIYNYVDKPDLTSEQITRQVYEALGRRPPRVAIPYSLLRAMALPFDLVIKLTGRNLPISGARVHKLFRANTQYSAEKVRATGFQPQVDLKEAINRMVAWYEQTGRHREPSWRLPPAETVKMGDSPAEHGGDTSSC